jgi:serine/threonine-protein kinase
VLCEGPDGSDVVKVIDFGLVEDVAPAADASEMVSGSPSYMAPELIVGGELDGRLDIYALGCVGYYLLTGEQVFAGGSSLEIITQHVAAEPEPPSARIGHRIDPAFEALVLSCLAKDPADRPRDGEDLLERLRGLGRGREVPEHRSSAAPGADLRNLGRPSGVPTLRNALLRSGRAIAEEVQAARGEHHAAPALTSGNFG